MTEKKSNAIAESFERVDLKTTLLAICGLSPKIITETLYTLHQQERVVDEVRVLTTSEGKASCIARLFSANDGHFFKYLDEYDIDASSIDFSPKNVFAVKDEHGQEIFDIDTEWENELFLKECMEHSFELTSEPNSSVYFLISGGNKTMSACLSLAAQCYGRPQDRIFHVMATPEFDNCHDFYYPPKEPKQIEVERRDGKFAVMNTKDADVFLVPMPFFSLRDKLPVEMLRGPESPQTLMLSVVKEEQERLVIDLSQSKVTWMGREVDLPPRLIALYSFFANHKVDNGCDAEQCTCDDCFLKFHDVSDGQELLTSLYKQTNSATQSGRLTKAGITDLKDDNFTSYKSSINAILSKNFGLKFSRKIMLTESAKKEGYKAFGMKLQKDKIKII